MLDPGENLFLSLMRKPRAMHRQEYLMPYILLNLFQFIEILQISHCNRCCAIKAIH